MPIIDGTPGDDRLDGTEDADIMNGYAGDDWFLGRGGNDSIYGGDGDDYINGSEGDDFIDGGDGIDTISFAGAGYGITTPVYISMLAGYGYSDDAYGVDTFVNIENVYGSGSNDIIIGDHDDNVLAGLASHDMLYGNGGNDTLLGGNDDDFMRGGLGDDILDGWYGWDRVSYADATSGVTVDLNIQGVAQNTGWGWDTLIAIDHASGSIHDDTITGDGGDNWLWGGSDGSGVTGNDTISGGAGNDLIWVGTGNHTLDGGAGTDTLSLFGNGTDITSDGVFVRLSEQGSSYETLQGTMLLTGFENLSGSIYDDGLWGDAVDNWIGGDLGDDDIRGFDGNDILYGDGRATVDTHGTGGSGPITFYSDVSEIDSSAQGGRDVMFGGNGDDFIFGGGGPDLMFGEAGNDVVIGSTGNDYLSGGAGDDFLDGSDGIDRVAFQSGATGGITVDLNIQNVAQNTGQGWDVLISIEQASGTIYNDTIIGNDDSNWLWGGSDGSGSMITGNDTIDGRGGDDLIEVGAGTHLLDGGTGNDTLSLWGNHTDISAAGVTFSLALQGLAQDSEQGMMTASNFENLSGSRYDDALTGDNNANVLAGDEGDDWLSGGRGDDVLYGDGRIIVDTEDAGTAGPITTYGDISATYPGTFVAGDDTLDGGKGNDLLYGGGGDDLMTGGQGSDAFVIEASSGDDVVTDFSKSHDLIVFDVAGVDDFGDLTLTAVGGDTLITWGTGDSLLLQGVRPKQLDASAFDFGASVSATDDPGLFG